MGDSMLAHQGSYDAIIVGAGLSGLSTAKLLHDFGLKVLVLEASERVGGRLHTERNEKCRWVDWGGAYVGPSQTRVLRLTKEMGLEMYKVHNTGDWLYYNNGKRSRFSNSLPPMRHPLAWVDANNIFRKIDELGEKIPVAEPWKAKDAEVMDKMTLQEWLNKNVWTQSAMDAVKGFARVNFTAEPHEVSLLWALWYVRQAGGTVAINVTENGAQEMKFEGGAAQLPERMAEKLGLGSRVLLNHPVCKVDHSNTGALITTTNGKQFKTNYVIFGNPPALQMKIEYSPSLPSTRNQLIQRVPMGSIIKTMVYYKTPFWREKGLVGTVFIDDPDPTLPVIGTMDDTKSDGSHACIMGFVLADKGRAMLSYSKEERVRVITECYARVFGLTEFLHPIHYEEKDWMADPWTGGCYTGFMGPGFLTKFGPALRKPIGRLYFAGTESGTEWTGYMEGAIQSGERAAREVLHDMGKITKSEIWQREPDNPDYPNSEIEAGFVSRNLPSVPGLIKAGTALGAAAITRSILKSKV